jgi:outer membrane receptor protein involved in Fe transport
MFRTLSKLKLEVSAEVFYKNTQKYSEFIDGADFLNSNTEQVVLQGQQEAYGVELMLKLNRTKLNGWISYTYSHTKVKIDGANDWQKINNGDAFNSNYDIPNVLNSVLNWRISKRIVLTSLVSYQSGKPITAPISVYYLGGVPYIKYSDRNAYRIPDYFRMDLSLTVEGNLRQKKFLHSSWMFSVYNLTGRKNPYSVYFNNEDGHINAYKYSVIGTPIFTVSWIFKLGNYLAE